VRVWKRFGQPPSDPHAHQDTHRLGHPEPYSDVNGDDDLDPDANANSESDGDA
jgi:hypothetical protein